MKYFYLSKSIIAGVLCVNTVIVSLALSASVRAEAPGGESYAPPPGATSRSYPSTAPQSIDQSRTNRHSDNGWFGLIGLAGLAGLLSMKNRKLE